MHTWLELPRNGITTLPCSLAGAWALTWEIKVLRVGRGRVPQALKRPACQASGKCIRIGLRHG